MQQEWTKSNEICPKSGWLMSVILSHHPRNHYWPMGQTLPWHSCTLPLEYITVIEQACQGLNGRVLRCSNPFKTNLNGAEVEALSQLKRDKKQDNTYSGQGVAMMVMDKRTISARPY